MMPWGCSADYESRTARANRSLMAFLIRYTRAQMDAFQEERVFDLSCNPSDRSERWLKVADLYARVVEFGYRCDFSLGKKSFHTACSPCNNCGLLSAFYVDETTVIRISDVREHPVGPTSPALRLSSEETRLIGGRNKTAP